jgi:hypothetical protein
MSSLDGVEIDAELFELLADEDRVMPHVHLSLQHGDDLILKRMKRRHTRADAVRLVERLRSRRADIAIGADLIAGFPTEDEAMHAANLSVMRELGVVHGHVFPYSPRPGTPAARMPQVSPATIRARAAELRAEVAAVRGVWLRGLLGTRAVGARREPTAPATRAISPGSPCPPARRAARRRGHAARDRGRPAAMSEASWTERLFGGFRKTSERLSENLTAAVSTAKLDDATLDQVEDALILSDLGPSAAARIRAKLAEKRFGLAITERELKEAVAEEIAAILRPVAKPLEITAFPRPQVVLGDRRQRQRQDRPRSQSSRTCSRRTTTACCSPPATPFRAAAIGQLAVWAERVGVDVVRGPEGRRPGEHRVRRGQARDRHRHRRADRRHRRAAAEQARADGRAGQDPPRARPAQPRGASTTWCWCSMPPTARTR